MTRNHTLFAGMDAMILISSIELILVQTSTGCCSIAV